MLMQQRLPQPYRPEADIVAERLRSLQGKLDWAAAAQVAAPWVQTVREHPAPFWAMESLLQEYPISSAEGLALMRLAEALLRVPDMDTAIALTADQLGRADFAQAGDQVLARLSRAAIAMSKHFLPDAQGAAGGSGLMGRLGAHTVVAATLRAVQLLGRQFVLGQSMAEAMRHADSARQAQSQGLRFSYDMLGEGARTAADVERYERIYADAITAVGLTAKGQGPEAGHGVSVKLSALSPRYEATHEDRVWSELYPRIRRLALIAAAANINFTMDLALKDMGFALEYGKEFGVPLALATLTNEQFVMAKAAYGGEAWSSQVVKLLEDATGSDLRAPGFPAELE
jgi:RHH-type proline utilization regulon transcriptional repressor/proline dehydrogenase/delta 1-pyrroline-5-carboxylate dehydrogenase